MKARQYTEEQIIAVLKEGEAGAKVPDLCRKYGMCDAIYLNSVRRLPIYANEYQGFGIVLRGFDS